MGELDFNGLKRVVVKEELVALTGDLEQAIMLNQFIYWSQRIRDFDNFIDEEKSRGKKEGFEDINIDYQNGWIYKDMKEFRDELMFTSSISTVSRKLDKLVENEWINRRNNPKYRWDKTYQYRVNLVKIAIDLFDIGYVLQDYKINLTEILNLSNLQNESTELHNCETFKNSNLQNESMELQNESTELQNERAIPEITTEITTEIKFNQSSKEKDDGLIEFNKQLSNAGFKTYDQLISDLNLVDDSFEYTAQRYLSCVKKAIWEMYYFEDTKIKGKKIGKYDVIKTLQNINFDIIESSIYKIIEISKENKISYQVGLMKSIIFNQIFESEAEIQSIFNYDFNRNTIDDNNANEIKRNINKTRFHNFEGRTEKYSSAELNKRVEEISNKKIQEYKSAKERYSNDL